MKTIKDVDAKVEPFQDDLDKSIVDQLPSFRKLFKAAIGMAIRTDGQQAIDLYQLGLKFKVTEPDVSLENSEFDMLKESCSKNTAQWLSHYHAQVMLKLKEAEGK